MKRNKTRLQSQLFFGFTPTNGWNYNSIKNLTVFLSLATGDIFKPAMMAIKELKLPMLKHSLAASIQYSTTRTLLFFFGICSMKNDKSVKSGDSLFYTSFFLF